MLDIGFAPIDSRMERRSGMKRPRVCLCAVAAMWLLPNVWACADGDGPATPESPKASGTVLVDRSPAQKLPAWLHLGWQIRGRAEQARGASLADSHGDGYYLSRIRVDLGIAVTPWLEIFGQTQDARVGAYRTARPPTTVYNPIDFRQGYVSVKREGAIGMAARAGRMEMAFGSERLIGPSDWNMSRTFDALQFTLTRRRSRVDLIAGSVVQIDSNRTDRHKPGEHFYGAYGSVRSGAGSVNVEPYVLFKQTRQIQSETGLRGDGLVTSPGLRIFGKTARRLDYSVEAIVQHGSYSGDRVSAYAQSYLAGFTLVDRGIRPRLSAEYNYASGDRRNGDGSRGTFDQFYPSNHSYYGLIDQFGWKNLKNWRTGFDCLVGKKLKLRADFNEFYVATVQDALYNASGNPVALNRMAHSSHIGWELNGLALYQWTKIWKFGVGYGHLSAGAYLREASLAHGYALSYLMFTGTF